MWIILLATIISSSIHFENVIIIFFFTSGMELHCVFVLLYSFFCCGTSWLILFLACDSSLRFCISSGPIYIDIHVFSPLEIGNSHYSSVPAVQCSCSLLLGFHTIFWRLVSVNTAGTSHSLELWHSMYFNCSSLLPTRTFLCLTVWN